MKLIIRSSNNNYWYEPNTYSIVNIPQQTPAYLRHKGMGFVKSNAWGLCALRTTRARLEARNYHASFIPTFSLLSSLPFLIMMAPLHLVVVKREG